MIRSLKKMVILFSTILLCELASAQWDSDSLPQKVASSFKALYPELDPHNAYKIHWIHDWDRYEAIFNRNGTKNKVYFDPHGQWINSEIEDVPIQELPLAIWEALRFSNYKEWKAHDGNILLNPNGIIYEIKVKKGIHDRKLYFDEYGNLINKTIPTK